MGIKVTVKISMTAVINTFLREICVYWVSQVFNIYDVHKRNGVKAAKVILQIFIDSGHFKVAFSSRKIK